MQLYRHQRHPRREAARPLGRAGPRRIPDRQRRREGRGMNRERRKQIAAARVLIDKGKALLDEARDMLETVQDDEQAARGNPPTSLADSERAQASGPDASPQIGQTSSEQRVAPACESTVG